jgi:hypothetical protein
MCPGGARFHPAPADPTGILVNAIGYESALEEPVDHRGLPSPFPTFIVTFDEPVVLADAGRERHLDIVIAGLHTEAEMVRMPTLQSGLQAAVHPLACRRLFGAPGGRVWRVSPTREDVLGRPAPRLRERLAGASTWECRFAILAIEVRSAARSEGGGRTRPEVVEAWRLLMASRGQIRIDEVAGCS